MPAKTTNRRAKYTRQARAYLKERGLTGDFVAETMMSEMVHFRVRSDELNSRDSAVDPLSAAEIKELSDIRGKLMDNSRRILDMMDQETGFKTVEEARKFVVGLLEKFPDLLVFQVEFEELPEFDEDDPGWEQLSALDEAAPGDGEAPPS